MDLVTAGSARLIEIGGRIFGMGLVDAVNGAKRLGVDEIISRVHAAYGCTGERYHATRFHAVYKAGYDLGVQNAMELKRREQNAADRT